MNLEDLNDGLPTLLQALMGIPCQWARQPRKLIVGACAVVDELGSSGLGADERIVENVDEDGEPTEVVDDVVGVRETVHGQREATLQVTAWSESQRVHESARSFLEKLRTRIRRRSSIDALKALGIAVVTVEQVVEGRAEQDGRQRSQASVDLIVSYGVADREDVTTPTIDTARVEGTVAQADGEAQPEEFPQVVIDTSEP